MSALTEDQARTYMHKLLAAMSAAGGSDLFIANDFPPSMKVDGGMKPMTTQKLTGDVTRALAHAMMTERQREEFAREMECNFAVTIAGTGRFRINILVQQQSVSLVCRTIAAEIPNFEKLKLPEVLKEVVMTKRGLVLVVGATGSGKSTSLAAMIDHINETQPRHVVTIEDPIEFLHPDKRSIVNQREIGQDTESFARALRRVLRQDPDVILIGEMRDEETVQTALSAAETGHLVFSTVHTVDAAETVNRLIEFFPPHMHNQVRAMIAGTLKGAVSQRLVPTSDGKGRVAVCEVLRMTGRVKDMIMDPQQTGKLPEVIADGGYYGMQTFDQALFHHLKAGRISMDEAMQFASSPHDFKLLVASDGRKGTTMDDLTQAEDQRSEPQYGSVLR